MRWMTCLGLGLILGIGRTGSAMADPVQVLVQTGHALGSTMVAFSPDGRTLVSGGGDQFIKFWDAASGREFRTMSLDHAFGAAGSGAIVLSPDGQTLASIGAVDVSHAIKLWSVASGKLLHTLSGHAGFVKSIAFSPDGATLVSGSQDDTLKLWDVKSGVERSSLKHTGWKAGVSAVAFSPDGRLLAAGRSDKTIAVWDVAAGKLLRWLRGHAGMVHAVAFSPDGASLASGSSDRTIRFWDVSSGKETGVLDGGKQEGGVQTVAFSPNGRLLVSSSYDAVKVWDVAAGKPLQTIDKALRPAFSPDGRMLAAGSAAGGTGNLGLWDVASGKQLRSLNGYGTQVYKGKFSPDGRTVAAFHDNYSLMQWDVIGGKKSSAFDGRSDRSVPVDVDFAPDGMRITTSGDDRNVFTIRDAASGKALSEFTRMDHALMTTSADGRMLAFSTENLPSFPSGGAGPMPDDTIKLWDIAKGRVVHTLAPGSGHLGSLLFSADGRMLMSATGKTIKLWEVATGTLRHTLAGHGDEVMALAFSADDRMIASAGRDKAIKLWDTASGNELRTLSGHRDYAASVAFSPDGRTLVSGGTDQIIKLWDTANGQALHTLTGHGAAIEDAGFSPDGKTVFSGSGDKTLRLWRAADGAELARFINLGDKGWVVMTPEGYFNASSYDAADAINVVQGATVRGVAAFWDVFYRPDLVHKKLAGEDIAKDTRGITFDSAMKSPPPRDMTLRLADAAPEQQRRVTVRFRIPDAGGGIGEVRVFHNGKLVASDGLYRDAIGTGTAGPVQVEPGKNRLCKVIARDKTCSGEVGVEVMPGEDNEISVIAFNGENTIQSMPAKLGFRSGLARRAPQLWILPIGINRFSPAQSAFGTLGNAVKDAEDFARIYAGKALSLFKPEQIHIVGGGANGKQPLQDQAATRTAIMAQLDLVARQAKPEDTFVWFVASHGTTDRNGVFGIVAHDVVCQGEQCADKRNLITSNDILDKSKAIMAMNQLFIFDTCQSGALDNRISGLYDARMATLAKNMGLHLYASAQATEHASDSDGKGNGLFTGQLLAGLHAPEADRNRDQLITIVELGDYARKQTMALTGAAHIRGAKLAGASGLPPPRPAHTQTPFIMHFGRDAGLTKLSLP